MALSDQSSMCSEIKATTFIHQKVFTETFNINVFQLYVAFSKTKQYNYLNRTTFSLNHWGIIYTIK